MKNLLVIFLFVFPLISLSQSDLKNYDYQGLTPLHWASDHSKNPAVVEALLTSGADVNAENNEGLIPLEIAIGRDPSYGIAQALVMALISKNIREWL